MSKKRVPQLPKASRPDGRSKSGLVSEGAHLLAARRPGEAAAKLEEALEMDPNDVAAAINLGGAYILQGKHARAIPILEAAAELEPDNAMIWSNLGAAYLGKLPFSTPESQDRAIQAYEQALALDPRAPHVHYNLGLIFLERRDTAQASMHFYGALESDPNDRDAQYWLDRLQRGEQTGNR